MTLQHRFQTVSIKLCRLNDHIGDRKQGAHSRNGGNVLLDLHFHRRSEPTLVLALYAVIKSWCAVSGFAVSSCLTKLSAGGKQLHNIVAWLDFCRKEFLFLGGGAQSYCLRPSIYTESDRLLVTAAAVEQLNGKRGSFSYFCFARIQKMPGFCWGAWHQRMPVLVQNIDLWHELMPPF